ncbi:MAG: D-sedoheptulose 7-phosphate isomerase [Clostridia bacterium]|nr:D-sedoheptulose 7-phosphate isomerase [Clostridia bacterium]
MNKIIENVIEEQIENLKKLKESNYSKKIVDISKTIVECLKSGNKILIAGNGGSASDAQHFAGEIVGRFLLERRGLACVCLNTDTSVMTCIANDYSYDDIFSRQIEAIGKKGDIFIGISTSGNSKNVIKAVEKSKKMGITTIGFLGKDGGKLKNIVDDALIIPYKSTARVQEHHIMSIHLICEIVEKEMVGE